jgi:eukaryotic-like serine/threonine-protein kinase
VEPEPDISPRQIGGFRVLRRLASGATTDVLLARAEGPHGFERVVALKVLLQQFRSDPAFERMFAREASAYARLSHPAIVKLYDFFAAEGQLVMVLEFVDGLPLHRLRAMLSIGGERLEDSAALFIGSRIFAALAAAHSARDPENGEFSPVIHRDINPSNVLVPWDGHVKIADFGIAKIGTATGDTRLGFVKGTYGYMAPEQVRGETVTVRADVYAATLVLWELLARRKAIQRGALPEVEVLKAMAKPEFPTLDTLRGDLHAEVREVVRRGLEPNPDRRSITAEEMASVLRRMIKGDEGRASLSAAIARVRPAPASEGLAVTMARPTSPSFSELMNPADDEGEAPLSRPPSSRDPDATQPFNTADLPEDSGAFKRSEVPLTMGKGMRPEELEDLVGDATVDDPRGQGDLTLVEARRPGATDPPPTTETSSRPPNSAPSTLPLPASLPVPDQRTSLLGVVRNDLGKTHPDTLRFGPTSASPPRPVPAKATPAHSPPAPSGGPPSSRPVPRPMSARPVSSGPSSPGVAPSAGKPPSVPKPISSKPATPSAAVPAPKKAEASPAAPPVSTRERTLVSASSPSVPVPVPVPAPQLSPRHVPLAAVEVSPTLISPSGPPPPPPMSALPPGSSPVSAAKPATTTLLVGGATTSLEPPGASPFAAVEPDAPVAPAVEPKLPLPLADAGSSSGALPVPQNQRVLPTMKLARSVPPPRSRRRKTGLWAMVGVALGSALVGIAGVEVYFRSYEAPPHASASGPAKSGPIDKAPGSSATPPTPPPPAGSATSTAPATPSAAPAASGSGSPSSVVADAAAATAASAPLAVPSAASPAGSDADAAAAWMGDIFTDPGAAGHRVFVDGKVVGETPGPIQVRCGKRNVQVGSAGASRDVNVPCGGSVQVTP